MVITDAILKGQYVDKTVVVPANTKLECGTVLGEITASLDLTAYKSDANDGSQDPCYILPYDLDNSTNDEEKEFINIRVLAEGEVAANLLKLAKAEDTIEAIETKLKNNGILVINVQNGIGE